MFDNMSAHDDRLSMLEQALIIFEDRIEEIRRVDREYWSSWNKSEPHYNEVLRRDIGRG